MPKSDAVFLIASEVAAFRSSASDTSLPELSRVTLLPPNAILVMPSMVSLPSTITSSARLSLRTTSNDQSKSAASFSLAMTAWVST